MTAPRLVRVDTHKAILTLKGLCGSASTTLDVERDGNDVIARWQGRIGGQGALRFTDTAANREVFEWLTRSSAAEPHLAAFLVAAREHDGVSGAWRLERVAELLRGPRNARRSRAREIARIRDLETFFEHAELVIEATVKDLTAQKPAVSRTARGRRADRRQYGGSVYGPLLSIDRSTHTLRLNESLRALLNAAPAYDMCPSELFRLDYLAQPNPRGDRPSRATRWQYRHALRLYCRLRQSKAQNGAVQPITFERLLADFSSAPVETIARRRRMRCHADLFTEELRAGVIGEDIELDGLQEHSRTGKCMFRLRLRLVKSPKRGEKPRRVPAVDVARTDVAPAGRPSTHAPPTTHMARAG